MPIKVTFTEFTRGESKAVVGMEVEALKITPTPAAPAATPRAGAKPAAAAAKPAAPAAGPKTYNVKIEFLDKSGTVVDTQQGTIGPIAPGERKAQRFEAAKPGIVAFRYASMT